MSRRGRGLVAVLNAQNQVQSIRPTQNLNSSNNSTKSKYSNELLEFADIMNDFINSSVIDDDNKIINNDDQTSDNDGNFISNDTKRKNGGIGENCDKSIPSSSLSNIDTMDESYQLVKSFKALDTFLATLRRRKEPSTINIVKEGVSKLLQRSFNENELNLIITICPDAFSIQTQTVRKTSVDCVIPNVSWPVKDSSSNNDNSNDDNIDNNDQNTKDNQNRVKIKLRHEQFEVMLSDYFNNKSGDNNNNNISSSSSNNNNSSNNNDHNGHGSKENEEEQMNTQNKRKKIENHEDDHNHNSCAYQPTTATTTTTETGDINIVRDLTLNANDIEITANTASPAAAVAASTITKTTINMTTTDPILGIRQSNSSSTSSSSYSSSLSSSIPTTRNILTLSELESLAKEADDTAMQRRVREQNLRTNTLRKGRLEALPVLVGAVRRLMLTEKKTVFPLENIARKLSKTLNIPIDEMVHRFKLLVDVSRSSDSKFIEIKKKDHILPMRVVLTREEKKAYNEQIRPKILQKIQEELKKCKEIEDKSNPIVVKNNESN